MLFDSVIHIVEIGLGILWANTLWIAIRDCLRTPPIASSKNTKSE